MYKTAGNRIELAFLLLQQCPKDISATKNSRMPSHRKDAAYGCGLFNGLNFNYIDTIFITDGNPTAVLDDLIRCGARGLITEPNFASRPPSKSTPTSY